MRLRRILFERFVHEDGPPGWNFFQAPLPPPEAATPPANANQALSLVATVAVTVPVKMVVAAVVGVPAIDPLDALTHSGQGVCRRDYGQRRCVALQTLVARIGKPARGLTLNSDGTITGTPTAKSAATFTVQAIDGAAQTATAPLTLTVN